MLIHEKIMSGQFLLDMKSDRSSILNSHQHNHHHHHLNLHAQPPSPPMAATKMDIYSAYAYQQQLQQQFMGVNHHNLNQPHQHQHHHHQQPTFCAPIAEVLDLSRRCDSVETPPRKTPSPYQTSSSFGTNTPPNGSPTITNSEHHEHQQPREAAAPLIPANLLYSQHNLAASLYPTLYHHPNNVKTEPISPPLPPPPLAPESRNASPPTAVPQVPSNVVAATNLLQTFATAAVAASAVAAGVQVDVTTPHSPTAFRREANKAAAPSTPSSRVAATNSNDPNKTTTTRPFKAFPRDPLVIAANFAATDVLLDNPRVERYTEYRKRVLEQIRNSNGGCRTVTNPKMRRTNSRSGSAHEGSSSNNNSESEERNAAEESSDCDSNAGNFEKLMRTKGDNRTQNDLNTSGGGSQVKDAAYYERRRKNNAAAKKSRDRRRIKEDEIAIRAAYLERQNIELLCQIDALKAQLATFASKATA